MAAEGLLAGGGAGASFKFEAPPPPGAVKIAGRRQDTSNIQIVVRTQGDVAQICVGGKVVASTNKIPVRAWLEREGSRPNYVAGALRMCYDGMGVWLELSGHTAPTILTKPAVRSILAVLRAR